MNKTQSVIQRMRCKAHFFLNQDNNDTEQDRANTYGRKSKLSAPSVAELRAFEDDVARLIEKAKFRDVNSEFMKELERDKKIKSSTNNLFLFPPTKQEIITKCTQVITRNCSQVEFSVLVIQFGIFLWPVVFDYCHSYC